MAKRDDKPDTSDEAARQAAQIAVELTETSDLGEDQDAPAGAGGRRRGIRRVTGAIGSLRTGTARQSSAIARQATAAAGRGGQAVSRGGRAASRSGQAATRGASSAVTWLTGQVITMAPQLKIRDQATLRGQFPGRTDEEIAELLVERAGRASGAVGGAVGVWAALPVLPAFPAEVAAETLAVIGIEIKLVAELHEALGLPAQGSGTERARAYVAAWAHRRGVYAMPGGLVFAAGSPLARMLRRRLVGRVRRGVFALGRS